MKAETGSDVVWTLFKAAVAFTALVAFGPTVLTIVGIVIIRLIKGF